MNGSVYITNIKPITIHIPYNVRYYPYLKENIILKMGSWIHTKDMFDIRMDDYKDNFTVMTLNNSWIIENN
jgi:hypothetical protein